MLHPNLRHVFAAERMPNGKVAALIYFDDSVDLETADKILGNLLDDSARYVEYAVAGTYNPNIGGPVWYIP